MTKAMSLFIRSAIIFAQTDNDTYLMSAGFTYIYSGPYMYEYDLRTGRLYRVLRNSYFLRCTNY